MSDSSELGFDRAAGVTRSPLGNGLVPGAVNLAMGLLLALTRVGFDRLGLTA